MPAWTNATSTTAGIPRPEAPARHATVGHRPLALTGLDVGATVVRVGDLAAAHGWYDQAHFTRDFTRDFTALVGVSPGEYRAGLTREEGGG